MNWKIAALITSTLLSVTTTRAATLSIVEDGETDTSLTAKLDGSDFGTITGGKDNWTFELPQGYSFKSPVATAFVQSTFIVAEPDTDLTVNVITITQPTFLIFQSEIPLSQVLASLATFDNPKLVSGFVTGPNGDIDLRLQDGVTTQTPDGGATIALSGLAFAALAGVRAKLRK